MGRPFALRHFEPAFVPRSARSDVERWSVLRPMSGRMRQRDADDDFCVAVWRRTLALWRTRVSEWFGLGWGACGGKPGKMLNCTPACVGVEGEERAAVCNQSTACPWCWARESTRIYGLARAFVPPPHGTGAMRHDVYVGRGKMFLVVDESTRGCLSSVVHRLVGLTRLALRANAPFYSYRDISAEAVWRPPEAGGDASAWHWLLRARYLMVCAPGGLTAGGQAALDTLHDKASVALPHFWPSASASRMKHAVALTRRYPAGILTCPDPLFALKALNSRRGRGLARSGGSRCPRGPSDDRWV